MLHRLVHVAIVCSLLFPTVGSAQSFSCSFGQGACLNYGETICSSSGKCVNDDAQCFDRYQCDFEGFTCKSNVSECVTDYNRLLDERNRMANDYNDLLDRRNALVDDYNDLLDSHNTLVDDFNELLEDNRELVRLLDEMEAERDAWQDEAFRSGLRRR